MNETGPRNIILPGKYAELIDLCFQDIKENVESEYRESFGNSWTSCLGRLVSNINDLSAFPDIRSHVERKGKQNLAEFESKMLKLTDEVILLKKEYPEKNSVVPEGVKNEWFKKIEDLKDYFY